MAKLSSVNKNNRRIKLSDRFFKKRQQLKKIIMNKKLTLEDIKDSFINYFQYPEVPYPDLLLRTAGESRISNFLLYQITYTELLFIEDLWPDINADILDDVLLEFNSRNRTYGKNW